MNSNGKNICGCDNDKVSAEAREIVGKTGKAAESAIPLLQEIQKRHSYLPKGLVEAVSREAGIPVSNLYGVATFYSQFRFKPQGKYLIKVCHGTACHVAGADMISAVVARELDVEEGGTTADMLFSFEKVACLGCCALSPVVSVGDKIFAKLSGSKIKSVISGVRDASGPPLN
jgi:NADH-quinone oxidoreductase subunit E